MAPDKTPCGNIGLVRLLRLFPDDEAARRWFESRLWPAGPHCPKCGSLDVQHPIKHGSMTHRCRACPGKPRFSLKTNTIMEGSKLGYQTWALALYLVTSNPKGISSAKLARDLEVTQKTAWHLAHRIREAFDADPGRFLGPVEMDETYVGGLNRNKHACKKLRKGTGAVGKTAVVGARDRATNRIRAQVVRHVDRRTMHAFVRQTVGRGAFLYTDCASAYEGVPDMFNGIRHAAVNHSRGEYVRGPVHTQGIESFWAIFKRAHKGTFHSISPKHLHRYVNEFAGRHNLRSEDTIDMLAEAAAGMEGKRLRYRELIS
ncbi:MAG: IS1595 family transposase [Gammaproteobacteria bacterium]|nr:IS1595 family transposase [Gammaproteobacteria bacterium]